MRYLRLTPGAAKASLCVLALTLASACSSSPTPSASTASKLEKTSLVVGALPAESVTPMYIAEQRGIFAAHGLHVKIHRIVSTSDVVSALLNGSLDVAGGQVTSFISAQAKGQGSFRVLASGLALTPGVNQIMVPPNSPISGPANLAGKTIAVNASTGDGVLLIDAILQAFHISQSQVKLIPIPFTQMARALATGQVDAAYVTEPYGTEMEQQLGASAVADLDEGPGQGLLIGGFTVTTAWLKKYPHTAAAFAASITEAAQIADTDLAADQKAFETYLGTNPDVADVMAVGTFPTSVSNVELEQVAHLMSSFGELTPNFNPDLLN